MLPGWLTGNLSHSAQIARRLWSVGTGKPHHPAEFKLLTVSWQATIEPFRCNAVSLPNTLSSTPARLFQAKVALDALGLSPKDTEDPRPNALKPRFHHCALATSWGRAKYSLVDQGMWLSWLYWRCL